MQRVLSVFAVFFLLTTAPVIKHAQAADSSKTMPVRLSATVIHAQLPPYPGVCGGDSGPITPSSFYSSKLDGLINIRFLRDGSMLRLELLLPTGDSAWHLNALWTPGGNAPPIPAGPVQMCLGRSEVTEQQFNVWMNGNGREDPTLVIPMQLASGYPPFPGNDTSPGSPGSWINSGQVLAQLFARRCAGGNQFRKYGDLSIPAGTLRVLFTAGQNQVSLSASQAAVSNISQDVWADLISSCGNAHVPLPSVPSPGISTNFTGLRLQQSAPPALDESISKVALRVDALVAGDSLRRAHAKQLAHWLDQATDDLMRARPESVIDDLNQVQRHAENWMTSGILGPEGGTLLLADGTLAGLQIAGDGFAKLSYSMLIGNSIGINIQVPGFDLSNVSDRVLFVDNDRNLDAAALPTPPVGGLDL